MMMGKYHLSAEYRFKNPDHSIFPKKTCTKVRGVITKMVIQKNLRTINTPRWCNPNDWRL